MTFDPDETAVVIDKNGIVQAKFIGFDAEKDARGFLRDCQQGGVQHLRGAQVVSGNDAKRMAKKGSI